MEINTIAILILIGSFVFMMFLRLHIGFAMLISTILTTMYVGLPLMSVFQNLVAGINSFTFMAVPFFICAGGLMGNGGISDRLVKFADSMVGWMRGGMAQVNIIASTLFGGISGSPSADVAAVGSVVMPIMRKQGYDNEFTTCITITSAIQGILIPPSQNMIMYAIAAGSSVSIGRMFLAGFGPGIGLGIGLMIYTAIVSKTRNYPYGVKFSILNVFRSGKNAILALLTMVIVILGVTGGVFTATESAAVAVVYAFIVTFFFYREIPIKTFFPIVRDVMKTLTVIMLLIGVSTSFGFMVAYLKIPTILANAILNMTRNPFLIMLLINLLMLFLGCFMSMASLILILTPILLPVVTAIGIDPVHFGLVMILNLGMGLLTPPVGSMLYIGCAVGDMKIGDLSKSLLPFYLVFIIVLIFVNAIPGISMFLPNSFMPIIGR